MMKIKNEFFNMECWQQILNDINNHYYINLLTSKLKTDKVPMNNNFYLIPELDSKPCIKRYNNI